MCIALCSLADETRAREADEKIAHAYVHGASISRKMRARTVKKDHTHTKCKTQYTSRARARALTSLIIIAASCSSSIVIVVVDANSHQQQQQQVCSMFPMAQINRTDIIFSLMINSHTPLMYHSFNTHASRVRVVCVNERHIHKSVVDVVGIVLTTNIVISIPKDKKTKKKKNKHRLQEISSPRDDCVKGAVVLIRKMRVQAD